MDTSIPELLAEFNRQRASDPTTADRALLAAGHEQLKRLLQDGGELDAGTVHAGRTLLSRLTDTDTTIRLLSRYLARPLSFGEETWARWHLVDTLAIARRCEEVVARQQEFLSWARGVFPENPVAVGRDFPYDLLDSRTPLLSSDSLFLWIWGDGTQALCWEDRGQAGAWLQVFHEILAETSPSADNRFRRFNFLRTGAAVYGWSGRMEEALAVAQKITALAEEETSWEEGVRWTMEGQIAVLRAYVDAGDIQRVRQVGTAAVALLEEFEHRLSPLNSEQNKRLRSFCHNVGLPLRGAGQYDLALPLLQRAVARGMQSPWTFLSLAAALWATTKDRSVVLPLLKQAALRFPIVSLWDARDRPAEFADVADDPEFRAAVTVP